MTKEQAVDVIYLALNGGKASSDNNVKRDEIAVYFGTAMGAAIKQHIFELKTMAGGDKGQGDVLFEKSIPEGFYTTIEGTPKYNQGRGIYSFSLGKVLSLPYGWGVRNPRAKKNPLADFVRLSNPSLPSAFPTVFSGVFSYWTEESDEETTLFLNNLPAPICPMIVSVMRDPGDADDGDQLNAPNDVTNTAIRMATEYFMNRNPASRRFDDKGTKERET